MANTPEGGPGGPPVTPDDQDNQTPRGPGRGRNRGGGRGQAPEPQEPQSAATVASAPAKPPTPEAKKPAPTPVTPVTPPAPVEPQVARPSVDDARRMPWWRRLFGGEPQTPAERNMAGARNVVDQARDIRNMAVGVQEEARGVQRTAQPEHLRQPQDPQELVAMVEQLTYEQYCERKLREKYGEGAWGNFKTYLAGERAYSYNGRGEVQFNALADAGRRFWNVITDRRVLMGVGAAAIVGILTGGAGVAAAGGIIGAIVGRSAGELAEAAFGHDRRLRMQIAQRQYDNFSELRQKAQSIRSPENSDEDRIRYMNELVNNFYDTDKRTLELESCLGKDKAKWDKIKGVLTIAGSAVGVGMALSGEWAKMGAAGTEHVKMYDFDHNGQWHSIEKLNNDYVYHIRDAQGHITGSHTLGGTPTPEMLNHFIYQNITNETAKKAAMMHFAAELGKGAAIVLGAGIGHYLGMPAYEKGVSETKPEDLKYAKERIQKQLPETPKKKELTPEEKKQAELNEPKVGQLWTFDEYYHNLRRERRHNTRDAMVLNLIDNQPMAIQTGNWEVVNVDKENVTLESRTNSDANGQPYDLKISKKELQEKGKLSTGISKEHEKVLAGKDVQKLKTQFEAGNNIIVFRPRIPVDFFTSHFDQRIDVRGKYEIADFDDKENKIFIRNIDTGQRINDLNLAVFVDAIKELKGAEPAKEGEKEKEPSEYDKLIKQFKRADKESPVANNFWQATANFVGLDEDGDEKPFLAGLYRIIAAPDKKDLTVEIRGVSPTNDTLVGKVKLEDMLGNNNLQGLNQLIERRLNERETGTPPRILGVEVPPNKSIVVGQTWDYWFRGANPDTRMEEYRVTSINSKNGNLILTRYLSPAPGARRGRGSPVIRTISQLDLANNGRFIPPPD